MASLWIRSGCDMKVEMSAETYQVETHFKALDEGVLIRYTEVGFNHQSSHKKVRLCKIIVAGEGAQLKALDNSIK